MMSFMIILRSLFNWLVWAATCKSDDYVRMQGMKHTVGESAHRKEIVAGNLGKRLIAGKPQSS